MDKVHRAFTKAQVTEWVSIMLGCVIGAAAYPLFLTPNYIAPGGLTGLATVLNYLFRWPVGTVSLIMNIPLFLIGWRSMGSGFVLRSLAATLLFSAAIDLLPLPVVTSNPLLAAVFGGVMLGAGLGLILRAGATTGGTDMAARLIHRRIQYLSVGTILFLIDGLSVIASGVTIQVEYALYALISIYVSDRVLDSVMTGFSREKACYIISREQEAIQQFILRDMERGVTILSGRGGFSGEDRPVLMCLLTAQEVARLKSAIAAYDPSAFVFITEAHEVLGEGFREWKES